MTAEQELELLARLGSIESINTQLLLTTQEIFALIATHLAQAAAAEVAVLGENETEGAADGYVVVQYKGTDDNYGVWLYFSHPAWPHVACKVYKEKIGLLPFKPDLDAPRFFTDEGGILEKAGAERKGLLRRVPKFTFVRGFRAAKTEGGMDSRPFDRTIALIAEDGTETPWHPAGGPPAPQAPPSEAALAAATPARTVTVSDKATNGKRAAAPEPPPEPNDGIGFDAMKEGSIPNSLQALRLKIAQLVPDGEGEAALNFFATLYLTMKKANATKDGNGAAVDATQGPAGLSTRDCIAIIDKMCVTPERYQTMWETEKRARAGAASGTP